jgi:hypothetical protein
MNELGMTDLEVVLWMGSSSAMATHTLQPWHK